MRCIYGNFMKMALYYADENVLQDKIKERNKNMDNMTEKKQETKKRPLEKFFRGIMLLLTAVLGLFLMGSEGTGCQFLDDPEAFLDGESSIEPKYVLSVHEIIKYPRGSDFEQDVDSFFGKSVCVNRNYFLHSKDVAKIDAVKRLDNPDFYDLRLTLTPKGVKMWSAFAVLTRVDRKEMAFLIDGIYYRTFKPAILLDPEANVVTVEGPFDPATVSGLLKHAKTNFRKWNDK